MVAEEGHQVRQLRQQNNRATYFSVTVVYDRESPKNRIFQ